MSRETALARLQTLCARSEQCESDLRKKLSSWGLCASDSDSIIDALAAERFLDNSRFARAYAHDKLMFNGWGRRKITQGLWAKGIDRRTIDEAVGEAIDPAEYRRRAFAVIQSRAVSLDPTAENKMRLLRFGAGRGFEVQLLIRIINSAALWKQPGD